MFAARKKQINLLPKSAFEKSQVGKFLNWALTIGRYIVVFTELIVIICFLSRFKLDRDLKRIDEKIKDKHITITSLEEFEQEFRYIQSRLASIKKLQITNKKLPYLVEELTKITPIDIIFSDFSFDQKNIQIKGRALSNNALNTFLVKLKQNQYFSTINLEEVSSGGKTDPSFQFTIKIALME